MSHTEENHTKMNHAINLSEKDDMEGLCEIMRKNIEYEALLEDRDVPSELVEEIVCLIEDTLHTRKAEVQIGQAIYPKSVVQNRLLKLNSEHIKYVIESLKNNKSNIKNIRSYLLVSLYNAPTTMESYYTAKVGHDLYGASYE